MAKWWIYKLFPYLYLFIIKAVIIMPGCILYSVMLRLIGLNYNPSCLLSPSCTASYLGYKLECFFTTTLIRKVQRGICSYNTYQGHIRKIKAFSHHLSTK